MERFACSAYFFLPTVLFWWLIFDQKTRAARREVAHQGARPWFAEMDFPWSFCVSFWRSCFLLSGLGIWPTKHFRLRTSLVELFLLFLSLSHDVKKEKTILASIFNNRKQIYISSLNCSPPGRVTRRALQALTGWFLPGAAELGGVTACSWTCWYSPLIA